MKKVLFVACDFPPCRSIGGSLRSECFVRYLPECGWEPTVVALGPPTGEERYANVHRVASATPWHKPYEVTPYGWTAPMVGRVRSLVRAGSFELIYASAPPFAFLGGLSRFSRETGLPLVIDFRDAWSLDPYVEGSRLKKFLYRHVFPGWEKRIFGRTERVLFNTPSALEGYRRLYPRLAHRFALLPNGYDDNDFFDAEAPPAPDDSPLTIVHLGRFGIGNRNPGVIFGALRLLRDEGTRLTFRMIGDPIGNMDLAGQARDLAGIVEVVPTLPHREALAELCKADVALLYQEQSRSKVTAVAGKTHEYLRAGKPILAIAPPGDNLDLVTAMAGFCRVVRQPADARTIADALRELVALKTQGRLPAHAPADAGYLARHSRRALTEALVHEFEAALAQARLSPDRTP